MRRHHVGIGLGLTAALGAAAGCDSESGFPNARLADAAPPPGTISLSWTITDTNDSATIACDEANATTVTVTLRELGSGGGTPDPFNCTSGMATTQPHPPGSYSVSFELRGPGGQIATAPGQSGVAIVSGQDTPVGAVNFDVDAVGALTLNLQAGDRDTNCGLIPALGGGIDQVTLSLERDLACVPFDYSIGAGPVTTTCPPTPVACIEQDVDIVAAAVDSGRYQIRATGLIAGAECWIGAAEIRVPTDGAMALYPLVMAYQPLVPGCPPLP